MQLGDLLISAKLVTPSQLEQGFSRQAACGGPLAENLVEAGCIERQRLDAFLRRLPVEPVTIKATGFSATELLSLMMKQIYSRHLESVGQYIDAIKLPRQIVMELVGMAVDRRLMRALGISDASVLANMRYAITDEGRQWARNALEQSRYEGPAPVPIEDFAERVLMQRTINKSVTFADIKDALDELTVDDAFIEKLGPALNSGRAVLLYGAPGNGKTTLAMKFASIFDDVIYVPYAVLVEGQIMRVYDPTFHVLPETAHAAGSTGIRHEGFDERWVPCTRPFVVTGGELTLEMLDLSYDEHANFYEAPLHVKALGGCRVIDDFGRQLVSPTNLLNRWIVPMESRVDYLKLHTGKSFAIPFEEILVFSTSLNPNQLMDADFLRRLPYKLEMRAPTLEQFRHIFDVENERHGLTLSEDLFAAIVRKITEEKGLELAAFHPRFIVDQVVATCHFLGQEPHFEPRFIDYAVDNLKVRWDQSASVA